MAHMKIGPKPILKTSHKSPEKPKGVQFEDVAKKTEAAAAASLASVPPPASIGAAAAVIATPVAPLVAKTLSFAQAANMFLAAAPKKEVPIPPAHVLPYKKPVELVTSIHIGTSWMEKGTVMLNYEDHEHEYVYLARAAHGANAETRYICIRTKDHLKNLKRKMPVIFMVIELWDSFHRVISKEVIALDTVSIFKSKHFQETLKIFAGTHPDYTLKPVT